MNADREPGPAAFKYGELTEQIIGIFYAVYNELCGGFLESVYQKAMLLALREAGLDCVAELPISVFFRGQDVGEFRGDIVVCDRVLLELKAVQALDRAHEGQLYNYLKATKYEVGLILNFGPRPQFKRIVFDNEMKTIRVHQRSSAVGI